MAKKNFCFRDDLQKSSWAKCLWRWVLTWRECKALMYSYVNKEWMFRPHASEGQDCLMLFYINIIVINGHMLKDPFCQGVKLFCLNFSFFFENVSIPCTPTFFMVPSINSLLLLTVSVRSFSFLHTIFEVKLRVSESNHAENFIREILWSLNLRLYYVIYETDAV